MLHNHGMYGEGHRNAGVIPSGVSVLGFSLCQPLGNAKLGFTGKCACWFPCLASFEEFFVHVCRREGYFLDSNLMMMMMQ